MFGVVCHVVSESKTSVHSQKTGFVCLRAKSAQIVFPFHRLGTLRFLLSIPTKFQHQKSRSVRGRRFWFVALLEVYNLSENVLSKLSYEVGEIDLKTSQARDDLEHFPNWKGAKVLLTT